MLDALEDIADFFIDSFLSLFKHDPIVPAMAPILSENKRKDVYAISPTYQVPLSVFKDGERVAAVASSRMGKSYIIGKLMELKLDLGQFLGIVDPQGEYWTLQAKYTLVIIGGVQNKREKRIQLSKDTLATHILAALQTKTSFILDLREYPEEADKCEFFNIYAETVKAYMASLPLNQKFRFYQFIEEVAIFCPQQPQKYAWKSASLIRAFFTMGAKDGINTAIATQRLEIVDKTLFSNCNWLLWGKVISPADAKKMGAYLSPFGLNFNHILALEPHTFYSCVNGAAKVIKSGLRKCEHGGSTPTETITRAATTTDAFFEAIKQSEATNELGNPQS